MKAAVLTRTAGVASRPLEIREVRDPVPAPGQILLRVRACGMCRTDLHIVEGELKPLRDRVIPGHQIVGEAPDGARFGVTWMGGVDGTCEYCHRGEENLCDVPVFTGYSVDGGYAEFTVAGSDFAIPLPAGLTDLEIAPLLCAGVIGFRSLRVAGVQRGERVGLFGFGASAHLALPVLRAWGCRVYVCTRGSAHRKLAEWLGADWVGAERDRPPTPLDRAITFAPSGNVVIAALASLRKGQQTMLHGHDNQQFVLGR